VGAATVNKARRGAMPGGRNQQAQRVVARRGSMLAARSKSNKIATAANSLAPQRALATTTTPMPMPTSLLGDSAAAASAAAGKGDAAPQPFLRSQAEASRASGDGGEGQEGQGRWGSEDGRRSSSLSSFSGDDSDGGDSVGGEAGTEASHSTASDDGGSPAASPAAANAHPSTTTTTNNTAARPAAVPCTMRKQSAPVAGKEEEKGRAEEKAEAEADAMADVAVLRWAAGKDVVAMLATLPELWPEADTKVGALTCADGGTPSAAVVRREYLRCVRKVHPDKIAQRRQRKSSCAGRKILGCNHGSGNSGGGNGKGEAAATAEPDSLVDDPLPAAMARKLFAALTDAYRFWVDAHSPNG